MSPRVKTRRNPGLGSPTRHALLPSGNRCAATRWKTYKLHRKYGTRRHAGSLLLGVHRVHRLLHLELQLALLGLRNLSRRLLLNLHLALLLLLRELVDGLLRLHGQSHLRLLLLLVRLLLRQPTPFVG